MKSMASLASKSWEYRQDLKRYDDEQSVISKHETVQQKRKRIFNKDRGSIDLSLKDIPFYIWDEEMHKYAYELHDGKCCFVDIIGRPVNKKTGNPMPMFPYEFEIFQALFKNDYANPNNDPRRWKHIWIKKSRGAGATEEIACYIMPWLAIAFPDQFMDSQQAIVTGINMSTAKTIMRRIKFKIQNKLKIPMDFSDKVIQINGCLIEAYPAIRPDAFRGLHNLKFVFNDEADFFPHNIIEDVMDANEAYWTKTRAWTVFNSTANKPDGLMERIEKQDINECNYKRLFILVDKLEGYIYTPEEIAMAKLSSSFAREYLGEYKGQKGNLFPQYLLDYAAGLTNVLEVKNYNNELVRTIEREKGELMIDEVLSSYKYLGVNYESSFGIDPAFNSSMFSFVVNKKIGNLIYAVAEINLQSPSVEEAINVTKNLITKDYPTFRPKIWVDAAGVPFIRALKKEIGEYPEYHNYTKEEILNMMLDARGMVVCPVSFAKYGDAMNYHLRRLLELGYYRIDPDNTPQLWNALISAKYDEDRAKFNKKETLYNDAYDAARLCSINWKIGNKSILF